jgi:hypothetical protein
LTASAAQPNEAVAASTATASAPAARLKFSDMVFLLFGNDRWRAAGRLPAVALSERKNEPSF